MQVIAGNVFNDFSARVRDGAVGQYDRHANDQVAQATVAQPEGARVIGGHDAAHRRSLGPKRIQGNVLAMLRQGRLQRRPSAAGFDGASHVLPGMLADCIQAMRFQYHRRSNGIAPALFRAATPGNHCEVVCLCEAKDGHDLFASARSDHGRAA